MKARARKGWGRAVSTVALMAMVSAGLLVGQAGASADDGDGDARRFHASLDPVPHDPDADNGSDVHGSARLWLDGRRLTVRLWARGLDALPHAMHIHGPNNPEVAFCPRAEARNDLVDDGLIETVEHNEECHACGIGKNGLVFRSGRGVSRWMRMIRRSQTLPNTSGRFSLRSNPQQSAGNWAG